MDYYDYPSAQDKIMQGDIFDECPIYAAAPPDDDLNGPIEGRWLNQRVVVMTQSCDLAQSKITKVVVAPILTALEFIEQGLLKPAQIRDQVRTGRMFGLYFLPESGRPDVLSESIVDFRILYSIPIRTLDELIAANKRPARLVTPYREHLAQHFAVTYMRIALPEPYPTKP